MKYALGDICTFTKGPIGITKAIPGKYPMVTMAAKRKSHNEFHFDTKAVIIPLVSGTGHGHASMKRVHYQEGQFTVGSILCVVEPKDLDFLLPKFLHIYLSYFKDQLLVPLMKGAANVSLSIKSIKTVEIIVPSVEIQRDLIVLTEKLQLELNELGINVEAQLSDLQNLRQAILQEAIQGKLVPQDPNDEPAEKLLERIKTEKARLIAEKKIRKEKPLSPILEEEIPFELPKGWAWCRLDQITSKLGSGSTPKGGKSAYVQKGIKFFRSQNIHNNGLKLNDVVFISEETNKKMSGTVVRPNDILLNITGGSIGRTALIPSDFDIGNVSQHVSIIRLIKSSYNKYLHFLFLSDYFQRSIINAVTGAGREGLPKYKMQMFLIPIPPISEKKRIVLKIEKLLAIVSELEDQIKAQQKDIAQLMQGILQKAFSNN